MRYQLILEFADKKHLKKYFEDLKDSGMVEDNCVMKESDYLSETGRIDKFRVVSPSRFKAKKRGG